MTKDEKQVQRGRERAGPFTLASGAFPPSNATTKIPGCPSLAPRKPTPTSPREHNTEGCDCEERGTNVYQMPVWGRFKMKA